MMDPISFFFSFTEQSFESLILDTICLYTLEECLSTVLSLGNEFPCLADVSFSPPSCTTPISSNDRQSLPRECLKAWQSFRYASQAISSVPILTAPPSPTSSPSLSLSFPILERLIHHTTAPPVVKLRCLMELLHDYGNASGKEEAVDWKLVATTLSACSGFIEVSYSTPSSPELSSEIHLALRYLYLETALAYFCGGELSSSIAVLSHETFGTRLNDPFNDLSHLGPSDQLFYCHLAILKIAVGIETLESFLGWYSPSFLEKQSKENDIEICATVAHCFHQLSSPSFSPLRFTTSNGKLLENVRPYHPLVVDCLQILRLVRQFTALRSIEHFQKKKTRDQLVSMVEQAKDATSMEVLKEVHQETQRLAQMRRENKGDMKSSKSQRILDELYQQVFDSLSKTLLASLFPSSSLLIASSFRLNRSNRRFFLLSALLGMIYERCRFITSNVNEQRTVEGGGGDGKWRDTGDFAWYLSEMIDSLLYSPSCASAQFIESGGSRREVLMGAVYLDMGKCLLSRLEGGGRNSTIPAPCRLGITEIRELIRPVFHHKILSKRQQQILSALFAYPGQNPPHSEDPSPNRDISHHTSPPPYSTDGGWYIEMALMLLVHHHATGGIGLPVLLHALCDLSQPLKRQADRVSHIEDHTTRDITSEEIVGAEIQFSGVDRYKKWRQGVRVNFSLVLGGLLIETFGGHHSITLTYLGSLRSSLSPS